MKEEAGNSTTRESPLEKTATWQNSTAGSSVPYMSERVEAIESLPNFGGPFAFTLKNTVKQSVKKAEEINKKLDELQLESETQSPSPPPSQILQRPIKPIKKKERVPSLTLQSLPSFAATPKPPKPPVKLTNEVRDTIDVPPKSYIKDPISMKQNLANCFEFNSLDQCQDNVLSAIFFGIESMVADITQWYQLKTLDLSRCNLTGLNHLDTCFPMLEKLTVSHNELKSISGLPDSLRYLHASHNKLCEVDIYQQSRLQHVNLSHNFIQTFQDMSQLKSLRTLDVSNNMIASCVPFKALTGLIQLSLKNNNIRKLTGFIPQQELESLDLSFNRIERLDSIDELYNLRELNLNHNNIKHISINQPMEKLCSLRLSFNRLKSFDVSLFPEVRILFLDDNQIQRMIGVTCIARLDSFSLRDQGREKVEYNLQYLRGTRKLYLSGSPFKNMHQLIDFYSLEYLELCSSEIVELPSDFSKRVPNLCHLYLSTNRLQDIRAVKKLKYLRRLILIDNKLLSINEVLSVVKHLKRLNVLDLR
ncbi:hypothetical protein EDC94DRAFT_688244 [Helicostylum pulchrum]|nr:hypothetical protein EDC94DRAFT_688244 [Helicostylum pulchrum]